MMTKNEKEWLRSTAESALDDMWDRVRKQVDTALTDEQAAYLLGRLSAEVTRQRRPHTDRMKAGRR